MCLFVGELEGLDVRRTRLFARRDGDRQHLVYAMRLDSAAEVAMILPLPLPPNAGEDAIEWLDMAGHPDLFRDLETAFPWRPVRPDGGDIVAALGRSSGPTPLAVVKVGDFIASYRGPVDRGPRPSVQAQVQSRAMMVLDRVACSRPGVPFGRLVLATDGLYFLPGSDDPHRISGAEDWISGAFVDDDAGSPVDFAAARNLPIAAQVAAHPGALHLAAATLEGASLAGGYLLVVFEGRLVRF